MVGGVLLSWWGSYVRRMLELNDESIEGINAYGAVLSEKFYFIV